jgi:hypothetical protein
MSKEDQMTSLNDEAKIAVAKEYFVRADQGRADVLDLFLEDAELYFPKFGFGLGRQSLGELVKGFAGALEFMKHDYDTLRFIPSGEYLVVEGTSRGAISGQSWVGGETPGGRFCNVFRFRGSQIASLHVYLDPDYTGQDEARFRWGRGRRW